MKFAACDDVEPLLPVLVDGELPTPERALVEQHIATCPSCQEAKDEFRAVGNVLRRHFAWRAASDVTASVIRDLEDEVTLAGAPVPKGETIDEMKGRIKALRGVTPNERSEAVTNVATNRAEARTNVAPPRPHGTTAPVLEPPREGSRYLVGQILGGYRIDAEIAKGGMGVVYRATQLSMDRVVALKVLSNRLALDETFKKRFIREARAAATIDHPNVIRVYDAGEDKGETFFAMEFVPGDDAESVVLKTGPIDPRRSAEIGLAVARALEAAHERGIVHRDVKPANVLIPARGGVKLADLGLAKLEEGSADGQLTMRKTVMGSPNYMPPEQARDARDTDARSDVYSLGATLYHIISGERPWGGGTAVDIMARVLGPQPLLLPELAANQAEVDPAIRAIVNKACEKKPTQRYADMTALREALQAYLGGEPSPAPATGKRKGRTSGTLPAVEGKRRKGTSDSTRRTIEAGPSGRRAAAGSPRPSSSTGRALVLLGALAALGTAALVIKKASGPDPPPIEIAEKTPEPEASPSARPRPTPANVTSRTSPLPSSRPQDAALALAYEESLRRSDEKAKLDYLGEAASLLEAFATEHPSGVYADRARGQAEELHKRIAARLDEALAMAQKREAQGDSVGADELLTACIEFWGDEPAKTRAREAREGLRARVAKAVVGPQAQERPSPSPEPVAPDPIATPVAKASPSPAPAAGPSPSPGAPLTGDELLALAGVVKGKLEVLAGGRVRLIYDFQAAAQADDWEVAPLEPAWVREAFETLASAPVPAPYDQQTAWSAGRGALLGTGWRRHRTQALFADDALRIDVQAKVLTGRNLVVTCGDAAKPFVVGCGLHLSDSTFPKDAANRPKEEQAALAKIQKAWKDLNRPTLIVAREQGPFDWLPSGYSVPLKDLPTRGTHLTVELLRDDDGDTMIARCDASERQAKVPLGKGRFGAGPVGLEVLGRPIAFENVTIQGTLDAAWVRKVLAKK